MVRQDAPYIQSAMSQSVSIHSCLRVGTNFHKCIIQMNQAWIVSIIAPLLLNPSPNSNRRDLWACPGSGPQKRGAPEKHRIKRNNYATFVSHDFYD